MDRYIRELAMADLLLVKQRVEPFGRYVVTDGVGRELFRVAQEPAATDGLPSRSWTPRPLVTRVTRPTGEPFMVFESPYRRWSFGAIEIRDADGRRLGSIRRRFSLLRTHFSVTTGRRGDRWDLFGSLVRPWTFDITRNGHAYGVIKKRWSGAIRELLTDADVFGLQFAPGIDTEVKTVVLAAGLIVDRVYFKDPHGNRPRTRG